MAAMPGTRYGDHSCTRDDGQVLYDVLVLLQSALAPREHAWEGTMPSYRTLRAAGMIVSALLLSSQTASTRTTVMFTVNATANSLAVGTYGPTTITLTNSTNGQGTQTAGLDPLPGRML
jgi:hypothetical protein